MHHYITTGLLGLALSSVSHSFPSPPSRRDTSNSTCTNPIQRKPWSMLTTSEQSDYLSATLCLMSLPATIGLPNQALTRWDELQWTHITQTNYMHSDGQFLPWHRYYMTVHADMLRLECGYTGSIPYWDEIADSQLSSLNESAIFQPDSFGGDGVLLGNDTAKALKCVRDGPFANITLRMKWDTTDASEYCLSRSLSSTALPSGANASSVAACMQVANYTDGWTCFAGTIHGAGHSALGGVMGNVANAPGDPLFFLHHTWLDAQWWRWQSMNLTARLTDIGGNNTASASFLARNTAFGVPGAEYLDYDGDGEGTTVTLNHTLWMTGVARNVTVGEVMDVRGSVVCAEYVYPDDE